MDFSFRADVVSSLGRAVASSRSGVLLVHGGGSFGHPVAKKFGLSSSTTRRSPKGVAETRRVMLDLNARVCDSLLSAGVSPYTYSPYPLLSAAGAKGRAWLLELLDRGVTPVTFGDVVLRDDGFRIISGDRISLELSRLVGAERCIFVMDVDGILDREGKVIPSLTPRQAARFRAAAPKDVTGGISMKLREASRIALSGTETGFVSGFRPKEFSKALKRVSFHGTIVRVPPRDQD